MFGGWADSPSLYVRGLFLGDTRGGGPYLPSPVKSTFLVFLWQAMKKRTRISRRMLGG